MGRQPNFCEGCPVPVEMSKLESIDTKDRPKGLKTTESLQTFWKLICLQSEAGECMIGPKIQYITEDGSLAMVRCHHDQANTISDIGQTFDDSLVFTHVELNTLEMTEAMQREVSDRLGK